VTLTFSADPIYAIASSQVAQVPLSISSTSGHFETPLHLTTSGGSGTGALSFSVSDGTATGCAVAADTLTSQSAGTCIVTATKAADANYNAISTSATTIELALPAVPARVTTRFASGKSTLSAGAKASLRALAKKLIRGATVTVTGYATGNATLAKIRAVAVTNYLKTLVSLKAVMKVVTKSSPNEVTVATNKQ